MPEPQFEAYLSLLSKLLRLTSGQRAEITAELRDHLEERLHELEAQGHERTHAIDLALEELGDAAGLAVDFTHPHLTRQRRQLMRYTFSSVAVIAVTFVLAAFYWPAQRQEPSVQVAAQGKVGPLEPAKVNPRVETPAPAAKDEFRQQVEDKLARRDVAVDFVEMQLPEVFAYLSDHLELDFVLDRKALEDEGVPIDLPINLRLRPKSATVRTILDLVLRQIGANDVTYVIRDSLVLITFGREDYEIQVYDCRDLLANVKVEHWPASAMLSAPSFGSVAPELSAAWCGQFGGGIGGAPGAMPPGAQGYGGGTSAVTSAAGSALIAVIQRATGPDPWLDQDGEGGTISEFDGLLVVRHSQRVHRKIDDLLAKMRVTKNEAPHRVQRKFPETEGGTGLPTN